MSWDPQELEPLPSFGSDSYDWFPPARKNDVTLARDLVLKRLPAGYDPYGIARCRQRLKLPDLGSATLAARVHPNHGASVKSGVLPAWSRPCVRGAIRSKPAGTVLLTGTLKESSDLRQVDNQVAKVGTIRRGRAIAVPGIWEHRILRMQGSILPRGIHLPPTQTKSCLSAFRRKPGQVKPALHSFHNPYHAPLESLLRPGAHTPLPEMMPFPQDTPGGLPEIGDLESLRSEGALPGELSWTSPAVRIPLVALGEEQPVEGAPRGGSVIGWVSRMVDKLKKRLRGRAASD